MSDDFDPFAEESPPPPSREAKRFCTNTDEDGFDPWGDMPTRASKARRGLELPSDAPGLGRMWGSDDAVGANDSLRLRPRAEAAHAVARGGRILVVCTGNVCRSPYIHLRLAFELAGQGIEVSSAGTGALVGYPIDQGSAALLGAVGVDSSAFRARQLTVQMVEDADLVITATRAHRRLVVQEAPSALRKTFALIDFADLIEGVDKSAVETQRGATLVARLVAAAGARRHLVHARPGDEDADIVDPFKQGAQVFARMERQASPAVASVSACIQKIS
ncbi:arsenate reductase/protein-tyrosine-phosphatase family protein [Dermacoccus nishinomiyaensis]|uniref:arsenate reductase/protein-tyrosine-phosphatase family protein n=1 Tax=Dermacoccus nishinomiyaensis TaxID=1274 RepID=UPI0021A77A31|nr:hypothetical protein [Dermacoccus nishinomiyaensis]MCT1603735.1 hypothetical protein [Dermacoccus nishinomiyaensis]